MRSGHAPGFRPLVWCVVLSIREAKAVKRLPHATGQALPRHSVSTYTRVHDSSSNAFQEATDHADKRRALWTQRAHPALSLSLSLSLMGAAHGCPHEDVLVGGAL